MDCISEDNPDYTTIVRTLTARQYLAVVMRYHPETDEYRQRQVVGPMAKAEAVAMAKHWAKIGRVDYKP
jgi:outer membrane receptor for Fe3+-dicitrate